MKNIILPCAGLSSRYPNMRPKYLLTCPDGKLVIQKALESIKNYNEYNIYIAILKEHEEKFNVLNILKKALKINYEVNILDNLSKGPADTVKQTILNKKIEGSIVIKDSDSFFESIHLKEENNIGLLDLRENPQIESVGSKSFSVIDKNNIINNIVEKNVISNYISAGIYSFETSANYINEYNKIESVMNKEIFISHVISHMIKKGEVFFPIKIKELIDVGTLNDWKKYINSHKVLFVDIDGVVVENQSKYIEPIWGEEIKPLIKNVEILINIQKKGGQIIFTTSRPESLREITTVLLIKLGFKVDVLIMNLLHGKRYLINDYSSSSNLFPTAISINIKRNSNELNDFIGE